MHEIAASDDQYTLFAQWSEALTNLVVKARRTSFVNAELHHRNVGLREYVAQNRPSAVGETPALFGFDGSGASSFWTRRASSGSPGAGYWTSYSSRGNPPKS